MPVQSDKQIITTLLTSLSYLGLGEGAQADMQRRIDQLAGDGRFNISAVKPNGRTGQPGCVVEFSCNSYDPPVDGQPDPRALQDLKAAIQAINPDACIIESAYVLLHGDDATQVDNT